MKKINTLRFIASRFQENKNSAFDDPLTSYTLKVGHSLRTFSYSIHLKSLLGCNIKAGI